MSNNIRDNKISKGLKDYLSYYGGSRDWHLQPFRFINKKFSSKRVLYPGSWIHVTPSLVFQDVVYVDSLSNIEKIFTESDLIQYIVDHSEYRDKPRLVFHRADYTAEFGEDKASFDLLISLSSGLVSQACSSYLKKGGLLFVNNEHYDASVAYVDPQFELIGVFKTANKYIESKERIHRFFLTSKGKRITSEMVKQDLKRSPSKARHKLEQKAQFFLFQLL